MDNGSFFKKAGDIERPEKGRAPAPAEEQPPKEQQASAENYDELLKNAEKGLPEETAEDTGEGVSGPAFAEEYEDMPESAEMPESDVNRGFADDEAFPDYTMDGFYDGFNDFDTGMPSPSSESPDSGAVRKKNVMLTAGLTALICIIVVVFVAFGVVYHRDKVQDRKDQDAADPVIQQIDDLGAAENITLENKSAVESAREAYDALTEEQKDKVTNEPDLEAAESAIKAAEAKAAGSGGNGSYGTAGT